MLTDRLRLDGRVAIVTGGSRGIGAACALGLAEQGADVVLGARTAETLAEVAERIRGLGRRAEVVSADLNDLDTLGRLVAAATDTFGRIDIVVNNVGGTAPRPFMATKTRHVEEAFRWNVLTAFELTSLAAPALLAGGNGSVINIASAMNTRPEMEIDRGVFRTVLGHFASGVAVVTGMEGAEPVGFTCQSFFSLSIDPPLVAIAPGQSSTSWPRIVPSGRFTVNILADTQEHLARGFAASGADKFQGVGWTPGLTGAPRLADALAWIDCEIADIHDAGDHVLVIGSVKALEGGKGEPLVFYRAGFGSFRP